MRLTCSVAIAAIIFLFNAVSIFAETEPDKPQRPFYEYKGDYRGNINKQKQEFKDSYKYELMDLDKGWIPNEITLIHKAFSELPSNLYGIKGLKGFYRTGYLKAPKSGIPPDEVPAAALPAFSTIFRSNENSYNVYIQDEPLRIEFFNPLFFESQSEIINIIHHEFGHAYDISQGLLSVSQEWLNIAKFRILHLPPLDAQEKGDFIFTFLNDSNTPNFAPTALRQQATYSRLNPQEDFANSFAAYIHYPYFKYTNPKRYKFFKENVFGGKEYFPENEDNLGYLAKLAQDLDRTFTAKNWKELGNIATEVSRIAEEKASNLVISYFNKAIEVDKSKGTVLTLAEKSCYILSKTALNFRKSLARNKLMVLKDILGERRCRQTARLPFEKGFIKLPATNIYFYRENEALFIQFLDSMAPLSNARGFRSKYIWTLSLSNGGKVIASGEKSGSDGKNSINIDLNSSSNQKFQLPFGQLLTLKITIKRNHSKTFKTFDSSVAKVQFSAQSWFKYFPNQQIKPRVIYPLTQLHLQKD
jgi:hypothetical protein